LYKALSAPTGVSNATTATQAAYNPFAPQQAPAANYPTFQSQMRLGAAEPSAFYDSLFGKKQSRAHQINIQANTLTSIQARSVMRLSLVMKVRRKCIRKSTHWASLWRKFMVCMYWHKMHRVWWWWICMPRTSASCMKS